MRRLYTRLSDDAEVRGQLDSPNRVQRVRRETSTNGNTPTKHEGRKERALESTDKYDRLCTTSQLVVTLNIHEDLLRES